MLSERLLGIIRRYIEIAGIFLVVTIAFGIAIFLPPAENLPKGPITIHARPSYSDSINKTNVIFWIPEKNITVTVTFKLKNDNNTLFIYVMLPFTIQAYSAKPLHNGNPMLSADMGNISVTALTTSNGCSILNATLELNYTRFNFYIPGETVGIQVDMSIKESLFSIEDLLGASKTVTYTFFGDDSGVFTEEMLPYMGINSVPTINTPFIVQIELQPSYYFSNSQPPPIEYYIKQNNRWIMFSMDFLNGSYAQTLVCKFENPVLQSLRELIIFLTGISSALTVTSFLEAWRLHREKKDNMDHE